MQYSDFIKNLQKALNDQGEKLTADGVPGPVTKAALLKYDIALTAKKAVIAPPPIQPAELGDADEVMKMLREHAPHVFMAIKYLGYEEHVNDKELTALCWPNTDDCRSLKTVIGTSNAWCSGFWCGINARVGLPSTRSGSASSWRNFGVKCDYVFGAFVPIRHKNMTNHIVVFLWWIDKAKGIFAGIGGNQGDKVSIAAYNISGNDSGHDECINGPRYFKEISAPPAPYQPDGWKVGTQLGASTR